MKKGVFRNFAKFTGKHLCKNFFFNKVTPVFSCEFWDISKNTFSTEHLQTTASVKILVIDPCLKSVLNEHASKRRKYVKQITQNS